MNKQLIPAAAAVISYEIADDRVVVVTVSQRGDELPVFGSTKPLVFGSTRPGWLEPEKMPDDPYYGSAIYTPEGIFGMLCSIGFASGYESRRAIVEFAKIDTAEWARKMVMPGWEKFHAMDVAV